MPTYGHTCNKCGFRADIHCPADDRKVPKPCAPLLEDLAGLPAKQGKACDGTGSFVRTDELDKTAFTPYSWRP